MTPRTRAIAPTRNQTKTLDSAALHGGSSPIDRFH